MLLAALPGPAWWKALEQCPRLESGFTQESESAVFGKLRREGRLQVAKGGFLHIEYDKGMILRSDGRTLVQFDSEARTAQRMDLQAALADMPLLNVLLNPSTLQKVFEVKTEGDRVLLHPRKPGLPEVTLEGGQGLLRRVLWVDGTGAHQVLELRNPRVPPPFPRGTFEIHLPANTRWLTSIP
jgi:outer membrane lipoprotein-sorting protein